MGGTTRACVQEAWRAGGDGQHLPAGCAACGTGAGWLLVLPRRLGCARCLVVRPAQALCMHTLKALGYPLLYSSAVYTAEGV